LQRIQVTLFDANHCAGAVMFLIEDQGNAILYTGDIRGMGLYFWSRLMCAHELLNGFSGNLVGKFFDQEPGPHSLRMWFEITGYNLPGHDFCRQEPDIPNLSIQVSRDPGAIRKGEELPTRNYILFESLDLWIRRSLASSIYCFKFQGMAVSVVDSWSSLSNVHTDTR
jgi:hypothetical protein